MKKIITTSKAPAPVGAYSQAIFVNNMLFTSGQIAIHPESGNLILDDIETEKDLIDAIKRKRVRPAVYRDGKYIKIDNYEKYSEIFK